MTASSNTAPVVVGLIAGGGSGTRLGRAGGKQLLEVAGKPVLAWSTDAIALADCVSELVVVCDPERVSDYAAALSETLVTDKALSFVAGGAERTDSIRAGLAAVPEGAQYVAIHDGARPLFESKVLDEAIELLDREPEISGVIIGHPVSDTLKRADAEWGIIETVDRSELWQVQTPQVFRLTDLLAAYSKADEAGIRATDDAALLEQAGYRLKLMQGSRNNIKVTAPEDLELVTALLAH
jgi:2-C-methyl-D-erythritol 4-phosphate cytidylyltransferase